MASTESPFVSVSQRGLGGMGGDADRTVISLRGEHDMATTAEVIAALARAIAVDDADLVIDLSGVEFMGAATIGIIVRTRDFLRSRSRVLTLRSPDRLARRVIDICGLAELVDPRPANAVPLVGVATALRSWVPVPPVERVARPVPVHGDARIEAALAQ